MMLKSKNRRIGVLYAMEREAAGLLAKLKAGKPEIIAGVSIYPLPGGHVLALGGISKVNAAMAAQLLIDRFGVTEILNAGCAGALEDLPIATLVVGTHCVQHDVDTTPVGDPPGLVSTVNRVEFPCRKPEETAAFLEARGLPCRTGVIATGDWFARAGDQAEKIRDYYHALLCEMEACAAAQVCLRNGIPFRAVKTVSDRIFAAGQVAEYTVNFEKAMEVLDRAVLALLEE